MKAFISGKAYIRRAVAKVWKYNSGKKAKINQIATEWENCGGTTYETPRGNQKSDLYLICKFLFSSNFGSNVS